MAGAELGSCSQYPIKVQLLEYCLDLQNDMSSGALDFETRAWSSATHTFAQFGALSSHDTLIVEVSTRVDFVVDQMLAAIVTVTGSAVSIVEECWLGAAFDCALPGHGALRSVLSRMSLQYGYTVRGKAFGESQGVR